MQKILLILLSIFLTAGMCNAQATIDYLDYHRYINKAEESYFLKGDAKTAFACYDTAFQLFDFVFAKDCFMAAQAAYYEHDARWKLYLEKGFRYGLSAKHLKLSKVLKPVVADTVRFRKNFPEYAKSRKEYVSRINVGVLKYILQNAAEDQKQQSDTAATYGPVLAARVATLRGMIAVRGFPGDKMLGVADVDVLKELGYKPAGWPGMRQTELFQGIAQTFVFPILVHYPCTYDLLSDDWERLIRMGEVHPAEVALLHDNPWRFWFVKEREYYEAFGCAYKVPAGCYKKNTFIPYYQGACDRQLTDRMREEMYLTSIATDSAKATFQARGFKTNFGYWDCR